MQLRKHIAVLGFLPLAAFADDARFEFDKDSFAASPRTIVQATVGSRYMLQADSMIPFAYSNNRLWYFDIMAKTSTPNMQEVNIGFGQRKFVPNSNFIWGAYGFVDILSSRNNNIFQQFTLGAEYLSLTWDFRANAYVPFGTREYKTTINSSRSSATLKGHDLRAHIVTDYEQIASGYDVEIGRTVPGVKDLRAYAAYYSFTDGISGPRLRFDYEYTPKIGFNAAVQQDKVRGTQGFVGMTYTFGGVKTFNNKYPLLKRMTAPLVRDVDIIVVNDSGLDEEFEYRDVYYAVDNDAEPGGDGTFEHPYSSLQEALADPRTEGKKLHLKGVGTQEYDLGGDTITIGGGRTIVGNLDYYFDPDMNIPTNDALSPLPIFSNGQIVAEDGSKLTGIILDGTKNTKAGLAIDGISVDLENVVLRNFEQSAAIDLLNGGKGNFKNVYIDNSQTGIHVKDSQLSLIDSELRNNQQGLWIENGQVDLVRVDIENNFKGVVINRGNITMNQPEFIGNVVAIDSSNASINVNGGQITDSQTGVNSHNSNLVFENVTFNNNELAANIVQGEATFNNTNFINNSNNVLGDNTQLIGNQLLFDGGKTAFTINSSHLLLKDSTLKNLNSGVVVRDGSLETYDNLFTAIDTDAINLMSSSATLNGDNINNAHTAINSDHSQFLANNLTLANNNTALNFNNGEATLNNSRLINNQTHVTGEFSTFNLTNNTIEGGATGFNLFNSNLNLVDSRLGNLTNGIILKNGNLLSDHNYYHSISGDAVNLISSSGTMNADILTNNGTGLKLSNGRLTLSNMTMDNNTSHIIAENYQLNMSNSLVIGGENAFNFNKSNLTITDSKIINIKNGIVIYDGHLDLINSLMDAFETSAISLYDSSANINGSTISRAYHGITTTHADLVINNSYIEHNRGQGIDLQTGSLDLKDSYLRYNQLSGLRVGYHSHIDIDKSFIEYNGVDGINISGATQLHINQSTIANNTRYGIRSNDIGDVTLINQSALFGNGEHQIFTTNGIVAIHDSTRLQGSFASGGIGSITVKQHGALPVVIINGSKQFDIGE